MALFAGLFEINFWEINNIEIRDAKDPTKNSLTLSLRCQPIDGFRSRFQFLSNDEKFGIKISLFLFQWIINAAVLCPSAIFALVWAFLFWRKLLTNEVGASGRSQRGLVFVWSRRVVNRIQLAMATCGIYGLVNLPLTLVELFRLMAPPGILELPDIEVC